MIGLKSPVFFGTTKNVEYKPVSISAGGTGSIAPFCNDFSTSNCKIAAFCAVTFVCLTP